MAEYSVIWSPTAQDDLAQFWLAATHREALTKAVFQLEEELRRSPWTAPAWSVEDLWFRDREPLRVCYTIDDQHRRVRVVGIGLLMRD